MHKMPKAPNPHLHSKAGVRKRVLIADVMKVIMTVMINDHHHHHDGKESQGASPLRDQRSES